MQIDMKQPILDKNDQLAFELRERFATNRVFVLDLLASPGSGKTSTILATIDALRDEFNIAVIEGDIASSVDAEKIKAQGIPCLLYTSLETVLVVAVDQVHFVEVFRKAVNSEDGYVVERLDQE